MENYPGTHIYASNSPHTCGALGYMRYCLEPQNIEDRAIHRIVRVYGGVRLLPDCFDHRGTLTLFPARSMNQCGILEAG